MRAIMSIVFMVLILVSSASAFLIETSTSIAGRDVAVMNNKISGGITISRMWGSPTYVKRTNTSFAGPYAIVGNRTSVITSALRKGSYFTISHKFSGINGFFKSIDRYWNINYHPSTNSMTILFANTNKL
ncbi:MAG: hypothetical protein QXF14_04555, partial [Candidatus Woesearchaeota archaeon]